MRTPSPTDEDRSSTLIPAIVCNQPDDVLEVTAVEGFRLYVRFVDGLEGTVDMYDLVHSPDAGVFAPLADPARFGEAFVEHGAVTWPGELDLAPDAMYAELRKHGIWKLG